MVPYNEYFISTVDIDGLVLIQQVFASIWVQQASTKMPNSG